MPLFKLETMLTEKQKQYVRNNHTAKTVKEMSNELGTTYDDVYHFMKKNNLEMKWAGQWNQQKSKPISDPNIFDVNSKTNWLF
jgi:hypothetical protein